MAYVSNIPLADPDANSVTIQPSAPSAAPQGSSSPKRRPAPTIRLYISATDQLAYLGHVPLRRAGEAA